MSENDYRELVAEVVESNRYLALATTDGEDPWVAPVEYIYAEDALYFFSTTDSRHARHVETTDTVAVAIWSADQPEYGPEKSTSLNGVQLRATASTVDASTCPDVVADAASDLDSVMPPYAIFRLEPERVYAPIVEDGINKRVEVDLPLP